MLINNLYYKNKKEFLYKNLQNLLDLLTKN